MHELTRRPASACTATCFARASIPVRWRAEAAPYRAHHTSTKVLAGVGLSRSSNLPLAASHVRSSGEVRGGHALLGGDVNEAASAAICAWVTACGDARCAGGGSEMGCEATNRTGRRHRYARLRGRRSLPWQKQAWHSVAMSFCRWCRIRLILYNHARLIPIHQASDRLIGPKHGRSLSNHNCARPPPLMRCDYA